MASRSAVTYAGDSIDAFPMGGACRKVEVGSKWTSLLAGSSTCDLVLVRIPRGSKPVLLLGSTDDLAGTDATAGQEEISWVLDPGIWQVCTDRDSRSGPRLYLAIDPTDESDDAATAMLRVMEAAS